MYAIQTGIIESILTFTGRNDIYTFNAHAFTMGVTFASTVINLFPKWARPYV